MSNTKLKGKFSMTEPTSQQGINLSTQRPHSECEFDDPERSFRRGYQQAADEAVQAARQRLSPSDITKLENWALMELFRWRLKADVDETERIRPITLRQLPPSPPSLDDDTE